MQPQQRTVVKMVNFRLLDSSSHAERLAANSNVCPCVADVEQMMLIRRQRLRLSIRSSCLRTMVRMDDVDSLVDSLTSLAIVNKSGEDLRACCYSVIANVALTYAENHHVNDDDDVALVELVVVVVVAEDRHELLLNHLARLSDSLKDFEAIELAEVVWIWLKAIRSHS